MTASTPGVIVLGGTGFLGRRVVQRLLDRGCSVTVGTRSPEAARRTIRNGKVRLVKYDLNTRGALEEALAGPAAVINCIGFYTETRRETFRDVHVAAAGRIAALVQANGDQDLIHISGIGARPESPSAYVRARARGEAAVRRACSKAVILRPSVMFSRSGAFFGDLQKIVALLPVIPLFGTGSTRLQPVWSGDVAEAACRVLDSNRVGRGRVFELGGPDVFTYRHILERLIAQTGRRRLLMPVPFALWQLGAAVLSVLPRPPLTPAQVDLMRRDNTVSGTAAAFADLGIAPHSAPSMGLL